MKNINYSIDQRVFDVTPQYVRALIVCKGIQNSGSSADIKQKLEDTQNQLAQTYTTESLLERMEINAWKKAFQDAHMNPREFRPAHEALSRRVVQGKVLPSINTIVDIGNTCSLTHLIPIGVHPVDAISSEITLRPALGTEVFTAFGTDTIENPTPGEIILCEKDLVLTRAWVWRQSAQSITLVDSKDLVVNVDVLHNPDVAKNKAEALEIAAILREEVQKYCGGVCEIHIIDRENKSVDFEV